MHYNMTEQEFLYASGEELIRKAGSLFFQGGELIINFLVNGENIEIAFEPNGDLAHFLDNNFTRFSREHILVEVGEEEYAYLRDAYYPFGRITPKKITRSSFDIEGFLRPRDGCVYPATENEPFVTAEFRLNRNEWTEVQADVSNEDIARYAEDVYGISLDPNDSKLVWDWYRSHEQELDSYFLEGPIEGYEEELRSYGYSLYDIYEYGEQGLSSE